ncbi:MAG TPA: MarR family transcriptional regulator [Candidatus Limnocylindria bacterium]|jgi:DNA-binding MarR family transcriptional regulator|nr:MarR family transcriptional regulator [Candidatus Limnocylindria bacterium]
MKAVARSENLTARELRLWHAWLQISEAVTSQVARDVAEASGLSAADYGILERLVEIGNGRLRQRELAAALNWDKSRISHQLTRMQERDLLTRSKTTQDGSQVAITRLGRDALERARPIHAQAVRRHLIKRLTPEQAATILTLAGA